MYDSTSINKANTNMAKYTFIPKGTPVKVKETAAMRYGFGQLGIGDTVRIELEGEAPEKIRAHMYGHAAHHDKKFISYTNAGELYITRIL